MTSNQHPPGSCLLGGDCDHVEQRPSNELDYPPKFSEYEAEWSKRGYEPHIATLLAKADWSEDMINWQEDEIDRLHNEIEAGGSRERGTSPNRSCGTAGQSGPASSLRSTNEPGPTLNDAIRCIDYADCMLAQSGYTEDSTIRMRLANARAIISGASQSPNDGWSALCEAVAKADPVNYRRPTQPPPEGQFSIGESVRVGPFHNGEYSKVMKITGAQYFCDNEFGPYSPSVIVRAPSTKPGSDKNTEGEVRVAPHVGPGGGASASASGDTRPSELSHPPGSCLLGGDCDHVTAGETGDGNAAT